MDSHDPDERYQHDILPYVSRTFALTIPQLPEGLRSPVTNAYLLCRIADTIEDETSPSAAATLVLLQRFVAVVRGEEAAAPLVADLNAQLSPNATPHERDLIDNMGRVVAITARMDERQRRAIERCVDLMCGGMHRFQQTASPRGVARMADMDEYCYYVAGVVGEMLTELFCGHSPAIDRNRAALGELAVSFAQGLQMTNILKDTWEDRRLGVCWLPQEVFSRHGIDLANVEPGQGGERFDAGMRELVGIAHAHLRNALDYTLLIPSEETGIRRFCLWAVGLAVLTLRKIERTPGFTHGAEVKVSRSSVALVRLLTGAALKNNWMLRRLFDLAAAGLTRSPSGLPLPQSPVKASTQPIGAPMASTSVYSPRRSAP